MSGPALADRHVLAAQTLGVNTTLARYPRVAGLEAPGLFDQMMALISVCHRGPQRPVCPQRAWLWPGGVLAMTIGFWHWTGSD